MIKHHLILIITSLQQYREQLFHY